MFTKIRKRLAQEQGFTLIELLVVILIIGILAAVAIPTFLSQKNKATDSNAQANLKSAETVVESFASGNNGNYPLASSSTVITSVAGLSQDSDANSLGSGSQPVYYIDASSTAATDSYSLTSQGSNGATPHYWAIVVTNGNALYGEGTTAALAVSSATATTFPVVNGS